MVNSRLEKQELLCDDGAGMAGSFLGLPPAYSAYNSSRIVILPVPFDQTSSYKKGSDRGPAALIEASRHLELYDIETDAEIYKLGLHTAAPVEAQHSAQMLEQTYARVTSYLREGKFVVSLGGEHSITLASASAHAEAFSPIGILQLDAHADLREAYEGNRFSHACVMARILELPQVQSVVAVGIRSMSRGEKKRQAGVRTFFSHEILGGEWYKQVVDALPERVYMTIDLDVFDPALMPSTGTPEPGGLTWQQIMKLIKEVCATRTLVGFDVVELCPSAETSPDFLAAKLVYRTLSCRFAESMCLTLQATAR